MGKEGKSQFDYQQWLQTSQDRHYNIHLYNQYSTRVLQKIISGHVNFFGSERCHFNHRAIFESVVSGVVMIGGLSLNGISTVSNILSTPMRRTQ